MDSRPAFSYAPGMRTLRLANRVVNMALEAVWAYKLRSFFVILGVAFGISSLTLIVTSVDGANRMAHEMVEMFGPDAAFVIGGDIKKRALGMRTMTLSWEDARRIKQSLPGAYLVVPMRAKGDLTVKYQNKNYTGVQGVGATANYADSWNWPLAEGRDISEQDVRRAAKVCLLGAQPAQELFGDESPVGKVIFVNNIPVQVVGMLSYRGMASGGGRDLDNRLIMPLTTLTVRFNLDRQYFRALRVKFLQPELMAAHVENLRGLLRDSHGLRDGQDDDFMILTADEVLKFVAMFKGGLLVFLGVTASIAVLVGGFVLVNLFTLSVERAQRGNRPEKGDGRTILRHPAAILGGGRRADPGRRPARTLFGSGPGAAPDPAGHPDHPVLLEGLLPFPGQRPGHRRGLRAQARAAGRVPRPHQRLARRGIERGGRSPPRDPPPRRAARRKGRDWPSWNLIAPVFVVIQRDDLAWILGLVVPGSLLRGPGSAGTLLHAHAGPRQAPGALPPHFHAHGLLFVGFRPAAHALAPDLEAVHQPAQLRGLGGKLLGRGGRLLGVGRVALGHRVDLVEALGNLLHALGLAVRGVRDVRHERGHAGGLFHDGGKGVRSLAHDAVAVGRAVHRAFDELGGLAGGLGTARGQVADFLGHHGEALAVAACPRRLHGRVQGQEVGLEGDLVDDLDDLADGLAGFR